VPPLWVSDNITRRNIETVHKIEPPVDAAAS